jgi:hypothetical protein
VNRSRTIGDQTLIGSERTMNRFTKTLLLPAALAFAAGACSTDSTAPDPLALRLSADLAQVAADGAADDVLGMRGLNLDLRTGFAFFPAPAAGPGRDCPYDAGSGYHVCPEVVLENGFTINRRYAFFNAASQPMEDYDANLTASINLKKSVVGSVERSGDAGSWNASVDHARDMTVSGLQGDEQTRTWNGTGATKVTRARFAASGDSRTYDVNAAVTVANVVVPHRNNDQLDPWPLSGTITKVIAGTVTVTRGGETETRSVSRTMTLTFNGTQFASMTVSGPNGSETFEVDLAARKARRRP